jgi:hypothetical protein
VQYLKTEQGTGVTAAVEAIFTLMTKKVIDHADL